LCVRNLKCRIFGFVFQEENQTTSTVEVEGGKIYLFSTLKKPFVLPKADYILFRKDFE